VKSVLVLVLVSLTAAAEEDLSACTDQYSDCHDNCSLRFGTSTKETDRIKLSKCLTKCQASEQSCRDLYLQTQVHGLDPGALKNADKHDDDVREDNKPKPVVDDPPPPNVSTRSSSDSAAPTLKRSQPREEDLPKRTATRLSDLEPKKAEAKPEPKPEPRPEAKPEPRPDPKPEPIAERKPDSAPSKQAPLDSSVRDEDDKQKPSSASKRSDPPPESGKKKQRALDEWDPEALEGR
jgi:hypothetical protein